MKKYTPENPVFSAEFDIMERADLVNAQNHNASVKQLMDNEVALKNQLDNCIGSMEGDKPQFADGLEAKNVIDAINKVFLRSNENKQNLVDNLIAVGIEASTDDTWGTLLDKVLDMTDTSDDTVTAAALLEGYTAHDATGRQIMGDIQEMAAITVEATSTAQDDNYTYLGLPEGHYNEDSKVRTKNSNLGFAYYLGTGTSFNIKSKFPNDYQRFNSGNFIATVGDTHFGGRIAGIAQGRDIIGASKGGISVSYNSSSGILTVGPTQWHTQQTSDGTYDNIYFYATYKVYLIDGLIKN